MSSPSAAPLLPARTPHDSTAATPVEAPSRASTVAARRPQLRSPTSAVPATHAPSDPRNGLYISAVLVGQGTTPTVEELSLHTSAKMRWRSSSTASHGPRRGAASNRRVERRVPALSDIGSAETVLTGQITRRNSSPSRPSDPLARLLTVTRKLNCHAQRNRSVARVCRRTRQRDLLRRREISRRLCTATDPLAVTRKSIRDGAPVEQATQLRLRVSRGACRPR